MGSEWSETYLGNVIELKRGYDLPQKSRVDGDVPVVSSSGVSGTHNVSKVKAPGVVTGRYGTLGKVFLMMADFWPLNTTLYVKDFKGNDVRFISYFLRKIDYDSCSDKAAVPGVNRNHLHMISVSLPPLQEQKAIAHVLGTLDDRIELNRRMNETLEAMAQALFKSWFVDFDPVIDNALASGKEIPEELSERDEARAALGNKRKPLPEAIRTLFPDKFIYSDEMGWIPEGWEIGLLRNIAENPRRSIQAKDIEPGTPYIGLQDMPQKSVSLSMWGQADDVASSKFAFNRGEILFGKLRPYFHKVGIAPVDGVCSTDILVVLPKKREWYSVVFGHVTSVEFVEYTTIVSTGTKMPRTGWKDMGNYEVVIPSKQPAQFLSEQIKRNVDKILLNIEKMRTLSTLRDTLLPKLLSGEIRIPDAEKIAGGVV